MKRARIDNDYQCTHSALTAKAGVVLVTFASSSAEVNGFASALCDSIPTRVLQDVCRFCLASPTGLLGGCLAGHKAAVIIDSTKVGSAGSTVSILDLSTMLERAVPLNIGSSHGFTIADELRAAKRLNQLPERIIFFGFEVDEVAPAEGPTNKAAKILPTSVKNASLLVATIVETLKKDAVTLMRSDDANKLARQLR